MVLIPCQDGVRIVLGWCEHSVSMASLSFRLPLVCGVLAAVKHIECALLIYPMTRDDGLWFLQTNISFNICVISV
jgi:hypothetical protein